MRNKKSLVIGLATVALVISAIVAIIVFLPKGDEKPDVPKGDEKPDECAHELTSFEAKTPTCTEPGWYAYVTCSLCGHSTYSEKPALGHSFENGVCILCRMDMWDGSADVSWYNTTDKEFSLSSAEQLAGLAQLVNEGNTFDGITIKLAVNVNLAGIEWTPIGNSDFFFSGNFDGQGNIISDLSIINPTSSVAGLFGRIRSRNATYICNVGIENPHIFAERLEEVSAGALAGAIFSGPLGCSINNCYIKGGEISASYGKGNASVGGLIGYLLGDFSLENRVNLSDCCSSAKVILSATSGFVGGLVGSAHTVNIANCYSTGTVRATLFGGYDAGGLVGTFDGDITDSYATGEINCVVYNDVSVKTGCLIGSASGSVTNCYATGNVTVALYINSQVGYLGGLIGYNSANINNSHATGAVTVTADSTSGCCAGGLVGENLQGTISGCYATGAVSGNFVAGGLVGGNSAVITWSFGDAAIINCYATGDVTCTSTTDRAIVGGLIGTNGVSYGLNVIIANCYATGNVISHSTRITDGFSFPYSFAGGVFGTIGQWEEGGNISITNCYATGDVTCTAPGGNACAGNLFAVSFFDKPTLNNSYYCVGQKITAKGYEHHSTKVTNGTASELSELQSVSFHTNTLGWSADVWNFVEGAYPTLK